MKTQSGLAGPFLVTHHGSEEQISQGLVSAFWTPSFTLARSKEVLLTRQLSSG